MSTGIEWTEETWNPVAGCTPVSPGCLHCYAATMAHRLEAMGQEKYVGLTVKRNGIRTFNGKINLAPEALTIPLKRKKPTIYFVNSMSDLFHEDVPFEFIDKVFGVMALADRHTFQVLTKRPERMAEYFVDRSSGPLFLERWPLPNVWLGTSIENNDYVSRADHLRVIPATVRFVSYEPALGPLDRLDLSGIDWLIMGGESGPHARPMHPDWVRAIRDQCQAAGVPFFFKQWGGWAPGDEDESQRAAVAAIHRAENGDAVRHLFANGTEDPFEGVGPAATMFRMDKRASGRLLDGREWNEMPKSSVAVLPRNRD